MKKIFVALMTILILTSLSLTAFATNVTVLDNCDHGDFWQRIKIDEQDKREGEASVIVRNSCNTFFVNTFSKPRNIGIKDKDAYFEMWMYVDDASKLDKDGQIELNSLYESDKQEYHWAIKDLGLKNGWNYLSLKISEAGKDGNPTLSNLSMIRIYQMTTDPITMKIDNLIITDTPTKVDASLLGETKNDNVTDDAKPAINNEVKPPVTDITKQVVIIVGLGILSLIFIFFIVWRLVRRVKK